MKARLKREGAKHLYAFRKQTVEAVLGVIKSIMGFTHFHLHGITNVASEWALVALAYNFRRLARLKVSVAIATFGDV